MLFVLPVDFLTESSRVTSSVNSCRLAGAAEGKSRKDAGDEPIAEESGASWVRVHGRRWLGHFGDNLHGELD